MLWIFLVHTCVMCVIHMYAVICVSIIIFTIHMCAVMCVFKCVCLSFPGYILPSKPVGVCGGSGAAACYADFQNHAPATILNRRGIDG